MDLEYTREVLILHKLRSVAAMNLAARYLLLWGKPVPMEIHFNGKIHIEGLSTAFTNPTIEAGMTHARSLLEFMGLTLIKGEIKNIKLPRRDKSDIGIENYENAAGPLPLVTPEAAYSAYSGKRSDAVNSLLTVLQSTNKGLAHITSNVKESQAEIHLIEIASRGIDVLMANHFYLPLGLTPPDTSIASRARP
jgi:hypothetical protein